ncbi:MAG: hypothetical protein ACUZ9M_00660 [Candidatus Scalindua sp.]
MAKEQIHQWIRQLIVVAAIVFAAGTSFKQIQGNAEAITDNKKETREDVKKIIEDVEVIEDDIVDLKLQYKDIEKFYESINGTLIRMDVAQTEFRSDMRGELKEGRVMRQKIVVDVARTIEKVNQLIRD